ncbi:MAG: diacylglycerol kinase family protein [Wenzhouxiangellaceae bacterium]|nr:diacylglycerol kinase family protein [Wenzhouxiangellaceae bacterium]
MQISTFEPAPATPSQSSGRTGGLAALINPLSFRMSLRDRAERSAASIRAHGGEVFEVNGLDSIQQALHEALQRPIGRLVLAGGDGTLQATATWLARHRDQYPLPELIVLAAGRTNYVAADLGTRKNFLATLERILETGVDGLHPVDRATLALKHPSIGTEHGFFMAGAIVDQVIRDVHRWQEEHPGWRRRHHAASAFGVARIALRRLFGVHRFESPRLEIEAAGLGRIGGPCRFLLATTLLLGRSLVDPYARRGEGALRLTAVRRDARALYRHLPRLVSGRFSAAMNPKVGYLSGNCSRIRIHGIGAITLDGQEFDLDVRTPLTIETGQVFRFLRP